MTSWAHFTFPWDIIVIHGPCTDGYVAGWIIWRTLPADYRAAMAAFGGLYSATNGGETHGAKGAVLAAHMLSAGFPVVFIETHPDETLPIDLAAGRRVLFCDRGPGSNVAELVKCAAQVRVIDHHSGSAALITGVSTCAAAYVDNPNYSYLYEPGRTHSGASLTWGEFMPGVPVPRFVRCVQIADTWNWDQEPGLRVDDAMTSLRADGALQSFVTIDAAAATFDADYGAHVARGRTINAFIDKEADDIARTATVGGINSDGRIYSVLYVQSSVHISKVGNRIRDLLAPESAGWSYRGLPIDMTAVWRYDAEKREVYVSLRGNRDDVDLAAVAKGVRGEGARPGGGHRAAAGFTIVGIENLHDVIVPPFAY